MKQPVTNTFEFDPDEEDVPVWSLLSWDLPGNRAKVKKIQVKEPRSNTRR